MTDLRSTTPLPPEDAQALGEAEELAQQIDNLGEELGADSVLTSTLEQLRGSLATAVAYLEDPQHTLAFIGSIGAGKTTAICHLLGLLDEEGKPALATGSGRITLCEVILQPSDSLRLTVEPLGEDGALACLCDFIDAFGTTAVAAGQERPEAGPLSSEVERWLRNSLDLPSRFSRDEKTGRTVRHDPARERFRELDGDRETYREELWARLDYSARTLRELEAPAGAGMNWLRRTFGEVNHGRMPGVPLPERIVVGLPKALTDFAGLEIKVADTKGMDETAEREDLDRQVRDPRTLAVVCSRFNDAPEANARALLKHARELGLEERLADECILLVLERAEEAAQVSDLDGTVPDSETGRMLRESQIEDALRNDLRLTPGGALPPTTFFDSHGVNGREVVLAKFTERLMALRGKRRATIASIAEALGSIANDRERALTSQALRIVADAVRAWIGSSRQALADFREFHRPLITSLYADGGVSASNIRGSVNRNGSWDNFDVYYRLYAASQKKAVSAFYEQLTELRKVLDNFGRQERLQPALPFIRLLGEEVNRSATDIYETAGRSGREVYEVVLKTDENFWRRQQNEWGRGRGYRQRVAGQTDAWFAGHQPGKKEQKVQSEVTSAWKAFTDLIETHLIHEAAR